MSSSDEERIAREEEYWTAPRLFIFGFALLGAAITLIVVMANLRDWLGIS